VSQFKTGDNILKSHIREAQAKACGYQNMHAKQARNKAGRIVTKKGESQIFKLITND
jgi:hypothetical protein